VRRPSVDRRSCGAEPTSKRPLVVIAVLPVYRKEFVEIVRERLAGEVDFAAGDAHLVESVKSAQVSELAHIRLRNRFFLGRRLLWQDGALRLSDSREVVVTDLNPRSITAWIILISRRIHGRRTLVWGHVLPRAGVRAKTVPLRRFMRRLADGVISYTWADREIVHLEDP